MMTETEAAPVPDRLLRLAEVRHRVGLGKTMIYAMIGEGRFPRPYKITPAAARWSEREVEAWIAVVTGAVSNPT
ncbi:MAG: helix-turn-helix transcriptional regulator [Sphingomonas sp.]|jgi:prophage regulatory protein|uniref:helix-turn-helix transcriptional regulator n=1 Tax=unclassified Sphingomonas TaxID=196159 RepID=UPI0028580198|nr:AlpA family phage regulatory protein [Sphingomonas sp. BE270]MDR7259305.1 prophage regulatory protein [Sphingomonas sp. BE270]